MHTKNLAVLPVCAAGARSQSCGLTLCVTDGEHARGNAQRTGLPDERRPDRAATPRRSRHPAFLPARPCFSARSHFLDTPAAHAHVGGGTAPVCASPMLTAFTAAAAARCACGPRRSRPKLPRMGPCPCTDCRCRNHCVVHTTCQARRLAWRLAWRLACRRPGAGLAPGLTADAGLTPPVQLDEYSARRREAG